IMQFKLEGQMIARNPHWGIDNRRLLHTLDRAAGTIVIDGKTYPLKDTVLPTIAAKDPYALSPEERACMDGLRQAFVTSQELWAHMLYLLTHGSTYLKRDDNLIFHGCVPVDERGDFLPFCVEGQEVRGKALFDALDRVLAKILQEASTGTPEGPS